MPADSAADRQKKLAAELRAAASRASDAARGGVALVFATGTDNALDLRLRAASGFGSADEARNAASAVLPHVREVVRSDGDRGTVSVPQLGARAGGGMLIHPLRTNGRLHGALAVGSPSALDAAGTRTLTELAEVLSLRFDYDRVSDECDALRARSQGAPRLEDDLDVSDEKSEEMLKLSEALFAQDIELLRSNEKLGKIERLKNDFIEKMSRELRTPLASIIEAIISVLTNENESLSESSKAALRSALDEGSNFLRTLQNILDLWRIKQGELPVEIQDVNLRELVDEAIFSIQDSLGDKRLRIEPRFEEPLPRVKTDLAKVNQILFLLLDNAAKFTPEGSIEIQMRVHEGKLTCAVKDSGVGICPDDQQLVFDEFFQVDEPSSQKYRGAGLGLTLVRDLVVLLVGEVALTSDVGRGTTVTFEIPVAAV
jgi:signal transduction histidine kinase